MPLESSHDAAARAAAAAQSPVVSVSYCAANSPQVNGEPTAVASSVVSGPPASKHACVIAAVTPAYAQPAAKSSPFACATH